MKSLLARKLGVLAALVAASVLVVGVGPASAGGSASHTVTVQNLSRYAVDASAYDNNDGCYRTDCGVPAQRTMINAGGSANLKCNTNESCKVTVTFQSSPMPFEFPLDYVSNCVAVDYDVIGIRKSC